MANRLANSTSPYLLAHAANPVDWWEWEEAAFEEARRRNLPVLQGGLRRLPLVPRAGARVVRGRRDGRADERAVRQRQDRPRGSGPVGDGDDQLVPGASRAQAMMSRRPCQQLPAWDGVPRPAHAWAWWRQTTTSIASDRPAVCWLSPAAQLFGRDPTGVTHTRRPQARKGDTVSATVLHRSEVRELWEQRHGA